MVGMQLFNGEQGRFYGRGRDGLNESVGHCLLDCHTADGEAVLSTSIDEIFAGAVITRSRVPSAIVGYAGDARNDRRWPCPATMLSLLSRRLQNGEAAAWCWNRAVLGWPGRSPHR